MDLLDDLDARGLLQDCTDRAALAARLAEGPITLYCGFDPTAPSLGWWNLQNLVTLRRFQEAGHRPLALAGGATGMIGDPSGRSAERNLLDESTLAANLAGISADMARVLDFDGPRGAKVVDNATWTRPVGLLEFLRDVGKHVTVNQMVAKESVRARMEGESGISFTEFSYMLLQGFDFLWLFEHEGCELQLGGSDQWGNIVVGVDLIRRKLGATAHALTSPLLVDSEGSKIGKSTGGTVFLSPDVTSPYQFFQHWIQMPDDLVGSLLAKFTFLPLADVAAIVADHGAAPERRGAQRRLAREVTTLVHGAAAAVAAEEASAVLFGGDPTEASEPTFEALAAEVPTSEVAAGELVGADLVELMARLGIVASKGEARRLIGQGAVSASGQRVDGEVPVLAAEHVRFGRYVLLRLGKKRYHLLRGA